MSNQHYDGNITFKHKDEEYEATVHASGTYTFVKGRRYMANGDPGYPDEEDFEIDDVDVEAVFKDGEEVPYTEDMDSAIDSALYDVDWEDDDPPEPDYDYYEEAAIEEYEADCIRMGY